MNSFFATFPLEYLHHDDRINPRNIGSNIRGLIEEFLRKRPQLHVALAWWAPDAEGAGLLKVFDGQHKAAACRALLSWCQETPRQDAGRRRDRGTWYPDVGIGPSPACAGAPAGETRYKAVLSLGLTLAPVVTIPAREARAFRVIDNRTSELTSWDTDLLPDELAGLDDLDIFSFDDVLPLAATAGKTDPDDIPETPKNPVARSSGSWWTVTFGRSKGS